MSESEEDLPRVQSVSFPELESSLPKSSEPWAEDSLESISDVSVELVATVGQARMAVRDIMALSKGQSVTLDKPVSAPVDLVVAGRIVAQGELVVVGDAFGVRITQVRGHA